GQVLPGARDALDDRLAAEAPLGADLAGHPGDLARERRQLVDHRVDGLLELEDLAARVHPDLLAQVALGHRRGDLGDGADLHGQVGRHDVDRLGQVLPGAGHALHVGLAAEAPLGADLAGHPGDLAGEAGQRVDHRVDRVLELEDLAAGVDGDLLAQVALGHRGGDLRDRADLAGQVAGHEVHRVGQVTPGTADPGHLRLAAEAPLGAHLAGHPGDLAGERRQLVDHRVDGALQFEDLAAGVDGDLLAQVTLGHRGGDLRDVADLAGQVAGHEVHRVGQVAPGTADPGHLRLAAEAPLGAHLAGHPRYLARERRQRVDHAVDGVGEGGDLALGLNGDLLAEVAPGDRGGHLGDGPDLPGEVARHRVHRVGEVLPGAGDRGHFRLAAELALGAHLAGHPGDLRGEHAELLVHGV